MKILLTGGFGTVGIAILDLLLEKGHEVTVFEVPGKRNGRKARKYASQPSGASRGSVSVFWGDIRKSLDVERAMAGQDAVVHCAAIVPPFSDENPTLCSDINVSGTGNIVTTIKADGGTIPLVFISSASVMGPTQDRKPPVKAADPVNPIDNYARSKVMAEALIQNSGIRYCILRLGAVMPANLFNAFKQFKLAFEIPLKARCEVVLDSDVATAVVHAAELIIKTGILDGSVFFIGGGNENGCQITALEMYVGLFTPLGINVPKASLFTENLNNYYIDWYDTARAQQLLEFQNHSFDDFRGVLKAKYRLLIPIIRLLGPFIDTYVASKSRFRSSL